MMNDANIITRIVTDEEIAQANEDLMDVRRNDAADDPEWDEESFRNFASDADIPFNGPDPLVEKINAMVAEARAMGARPKGAA